MNKINKKKRSRKTISPYIDIDWEKAAVLFKNYTPQVSQKHKYPPVKDILSVLAKVGGIALIFAFPGAAPAIGALFSEDSSYEPWRAKNVIDKLAKRKFVTVETQEDGSVRVEITRNGLTKALSYKLDEMILRQSNKWDKKWRVVIFDIPEKYKRIRDVFRLRLQQLGLYFLQESVYVSPYPCFEEIEFLRELYGVSFKVRYLLVEKIEEDDLIKEHFSLN